MEAADPAGGEGKSGSFVVWDLGRARSCSRIRETPAGFRNILVDGSGRAYFRPGTGR